jgi:hypothetical protein
MLTGYQCEVVAGYTEYGDILCTDCCADEWTKPLIRYSLDEEQVARGGDMFEEDENHVADCECLFSLNCDSCGAELVEEYIDTRCEDKQEAGEVNDERDPAFD